MENIKTNIDVYNCEPISVQYSSNNGDVSTLSTPISLKTNVVEESVTVDNAIAIDRLAIRPVITGNNRILVQSFEELADEGETLPELKKLFGNFILEKNTVLFPAERGIGKTLLALQTAITVAEEMDFLGETKDLSGNVLYLNMELSDYVIKKRLAKLYKAIKRKKNGAFKPYCISDRRNLPEIQSDIERWVHDHEPVLVVIDNLRTAFTHANNQDNPEMAIAITHLNNLRDKHGFALVLVHHTKKGTSGKQTHSDLQSGAGAITDLVDADFFMRRSCQSKDLRILKRAKSRNCEEQEGAKLIRLNPDTLWFELVADNVNEWEHIHAPDISKPEIIEKKQKTIVMREEGKTLQEIADAEGVNKSTISRRLKKR